MKKSISFRMICMALAISMLFANISFVFATEADETFTQAERIVPSLDIYQSTNFTVNSEELTKEVKTFEYVTVPIKCSRSGSYVISVFDSSGYKLPDNPSGLLLGRMVFSIKRQYV